MVKTNEQYVSLGTVAIAAQCSAAELIDIRTPDRGILGLGALCHGARGPWSLNAAGLGAPAKTTLFAGGA